MASYFMTSHERRPVMWSKFMARSPVNADLLMGYSHITVNCNAIAIKLGIIGLPAVALLQHC
eukprot:scaffold51641_cov45-Prasinocladus_malaysianus.AAC.1